jgi:hypothetical protein
MPISDIGCILGGRDNSWFYQFWAGPLCTLSNAITRWKLSGFSPIGAASHIIRSMRMVFAFIERVTIPTISRFKTTESVRAREK